MRPDRLARLHSAVDRQAGERIRVIPYTPGSYLVGGPDAGRAVLEIVATVAEVSKVARTLGTGNTTGHNAELQIGSHTVKFSTSALPYVLAGGDHILLLERGDAEYEVNSADPLGTDRTVARIEPL